MRVFFGSKIGHYFAVDSGTGAYDYWVSKGLLNNVDDKISKTKVKVMALGINDTYVAILTDGSFYWSCGNSYPDLHRLLDDDQTCRGDLLVSNY